MPSMISITVWALHTSIENVVPSESAMPYIESPNIIAMFHGPNPPFDGIAIPIELKINATKQGNSPKASDDSWHNEAVKEKA